MPFIFGNKSGMQSLPNICGSFNCQRKIEEEEEKVKQMYSLFSKSIKTKEINEKLIQINRY